VRRLLETFNADTLPTINEGFEHKPEYCLAPLSLDELLATIPNMNITPLHLAEFYVHAVQALCFRSGSGSTKCCAKKSEARHWRTRRAKPKRHN